MCERGIGGWADQAAGYPHSSTHVPIASPLGPLGDVYLDHTFREGRLHVDRVGFQRKIEPPLERPHETFAEPECLLRLLLGLVEIGGRAVNGPKPMSSRIQRLCHSRTSSPRGIHLVAG